MILIIDNGSIFIKYLEKKFIIRNIKFKVITNKEKINIKKINSIKGVILSGGPKNPSQRNLTNDYLAIKYLKVPIIGFCLGHEAIAVAFGSKIKKHHKKQSKFEEIIIDKPKNKIFKGLMKKVYLREKHDNYVSQLPKDFVILAHSKSCNIEAMKHKRKPIYGFQNHPEVSGIDGDYIIKNFLNLCGINFEIN